MGQTLPNGIYLPAEGERNCYDGLEGNWRSLDGLISTVAGKASASHTHGNITNDGKVGTDANKPLITGTGGAVTAGSFGTSANTFCEGNDSRLSDARTPVAHTHTKSDVTDLLNSNFIPSANNSYDLGSSSYQWNNVYSKNYYYNGTAWGLDKANVWSQINDFKTLRIYGVAGNNLVAYPPSGEKGDSSTFGLNIICSDKNLGNYNTSGVANVGMGQSNGTSYVALNASTKGSTDNNVHSIQIGLQIAASDNANIGSFYPTQNGGINLGTSANRWKTLNGINPGALSLLDYNNVLDVTSEVPVASLDGNTNIDLNDYIPNKTGWLSIVIANTTGNFIKAVQGRAGTAAGFNATRTYHSGAADNEVISLFMPIIAGTWKSVYIKASSLIQMRFYYCLGNV